MKTTTVIPITLTETAKAEIKRLMLEEGFDVTQSLRIGVKGGGCSGMTYILGFDKGTEKDEEVDYSPLAYVVCRTNYGSNRTRVVSCS